MTAAEDIRRALARLDAAMMAADYPARRHLAPGAPEQTIRDLLAPTGLTIPEEVVELWGWHNGRARASAVAVGDTWELPGGFALLSVEAAVRQWAWTRDHHPWDQLATIERDWLPIAAHGNATVWVDCSVAAGAPAPVRVAYPDDSDPAEVEARRVGSVSRLVELWALLLERRIWRLVRPGETWTGPDGRNYPLQIDHPQWELDHQHANLPPDWPE